MLIDSLHLQLKSLEVYQKGEKKKSTNTLIIQYEEQMN